MKNALACLFALAATLPVLAQPRHIITEDPAPERRWILGLDLTKTIIPAISGRGNNYPFKKEVFYTIEPTLRIETPNDNFFWIIQPGLTHFSGAPSGNTRLNMTGCFMKLGVEYRITPIYSIAALLTTSGWQTNGTLTIPSAAFSAYSAPIPSYTGFAGGLEIQLNYDFPIGPTSLFRFVCRANSLWRSHSTNSPDTPYIPGIGRYIDIPRDNVSGAGGVSITLGASLEYHYYLRGRW